MKILAFGTSNNRESINRTLAAYAAGLIDGATVEVLDIADYEMPIFSDERERALGQPAQAKAFYDKIAGADALVISFVEHNGSYTAAWKNLFDWTSRIDTRVFQNKPALYLATSPGPGGAATVLASAVGSAPYFGAEVVSSLSVHSFHDNFDLEANTLTHPGIQRRLRRATRMLGNRLSRLLQVADTDIAV
jgi:NAD(P)H-dependent FMN reductase